MRTTSTTTLMLLALLLTGCQHTGLSPRESHNEYVQYLMVLYDTPTYNAPAPAPQVPMRLAVAQIGEVAPPASLIDQLRNDTSLFARVDGVPGMLASPSYIPNETPESQRIRKRDEVGRILRFARDMGMTHLFLYGGTIDYGTHSNPLSVLDLTIVGMWVSPGKNVKAQGKGSGALIDLQTQRVVLIASAQLEKSRLTTTAGSDGAEQRVLTDLRDEIVLELGASLIRDARARAGLPAPATP